MTTSHGLKIVGEALRADEGKARLGRWYNALMIGMIGAVLAGQVLVHHLGDLYYTQRDRAEALPHWADKIAAYTKTADGRLVYNPQSVYYDDPGEALRQRINLPLVHDPLKGADNATRAAHVAAVRKQADQAAGEAQNAVTWICRLHMLGFTLPSHFSYSCDLS
jgi:hypothetical protein